MNHTPRATSVSPLTMEWDWASGFDWTRKTVTGVWDKSHIQCDRKQYWILNCLLILCISNLNLGLLIEENVTCLTSCNKDQKLNFVNLCYNQKWPLQVVCSAFSFILTPTRARSFGHYLIMLLERDGFSENWTIDDQKLITGPHCLISRDCDWQLLLNCIKSQENSK